jgi:hypothetical protein
MSSFKEFFKTERSNTRINMFNNITSSIGKIIKHVIVWLCVFATSYSLYKTITLEDISTTQGCKIIEINDYEHKSNEIIYIFNGKLQIDEIGNIDYEHYNPKFKNDKNTLYYIKSYSNELVYMIILTILLVIFTIYLIILIND